MAKKKTNAQKSAVRVIAGHWKGRRIPVPAAGVRPSGDRVRETLFNWLAPVVAGSRCLDLFAGSGALGIEALSRGAGSVVMVERNKPAAAAISDLLIEFGGGAAEVINADALELDIGDYGPFDIVFLDPPFDGPNLMDLCKLLEQSGALTDSALVYLEMDRRQPLPELPSGWAAIRERTAGQVRFVLAKKATVAEQE